MIDTILMVIMGMFVAVQLAFTAIWLWRHCPPENR